MMMNKQQRIDFIVTIMMEHWKHELGYQLAQKWQDHPHRESEMRLLATIFAGTLYEVMWGDVE